MALAAATAAAGSSLLQLLCLLAAICTRAVGAAIVSEVTCNTGAQASVPGSAGGGALCGGNAVGVFGPYTVYTQAAFDMSCTDSSGTTLAAFYFTNSTTAQQASFVTPSASGVTYKGTLTCSCTFLSRSSYNGKGLVYFAPVSALGSAC